MHLYIGNATKQYQDFSYRVPEAVSPRTQTIRPGGQIRITGDLSTPDIDAIVGQHKKYGLVPVEEIDGAKAFTGLCYSVNKPIAVDKLMRAMNHNTQVLVERGREIRKEASIAENNRLANALEESGRPEGLREFSTSIVEENHDDRDGSSPIAEGVIVQRDESAPKTNRRKKN